MIVSIHCIIVTNSFYLVWTGCSDYNHSAGPIRALRHSSSRPGRPEQGRVSGGGYIGSVWGPGRYRVHLLGYLAGRPELLSHPDYPRRGCGAGEGSRVWSFRVRETGHGQ